MKVFVNTVNNIPDPHKKMLPLGNGKCASQTEAYVFLANEKSPEIFASFD